jgi:hypothetical protein
MVASCCGAGQPFVAVYVVCYMMMLPSERQSFNIFIFIFFNSSSPTMGQYVLYKPATNNCLVFLAELARLGQVYLVFECFSLWSFLQTL